MDDLGPVLSTHKGRIAAGGYFWYLGALAAGFGVYRAVTSAIAGDFAMAGTGITGVFFGLACWIYPAILYFQTLTAHQNGFSWKRLWGTRVVRWADVQHVKTTTEHNRRALHMKGTNVELDVTLRDGSHVYVTNDLDGIEQIQGYLQRGAAPQAQAAASPWGGPPPGGPPPAGPASPWGPT